MQFADLAGKTRYRVYESKGSASMKEGTVMIARLVPFLNGWMITTEVVVSFAGTSRETLKQSYGVSIPQLAFVRKYHADRKRRMPSVVYHAKLYI